MMDKQNESAERLLRSALQSAAADDQRKPNDLSQRLERRRQPRKFAAPALAAAAVAATLVVTLVTTNGSSRGPAQNAAVGAAAPNRDTVKETDPAGEPLPSTAQSVVPTTIAVSRLAPDDKSCTDTPTVNPAMDYLAPPSSLAEMAKGSVAVVQVRATDARTVFTVGHRNADPVGSTLPYTSTVMRVEKTLHGKDLGSELTFTQAGGPGNCWMSATKLVEPGKQYVIAVIPNRNPGEKEQSGYTAFNGQQGLFELSDDGTVTRVDPYVTTIPATQSLADFIEGITG